MSELLHKFLSRTSMVKEGNAAPDYLLTSTDGEPVYLSELWTKDNIVVIFLRHLGCTFCRYHVMQLRRDYARFRQLGAEVVCVAMGDPKVGKAFKIMFDLPFAVLMTGEDTSIYQKYGLGRGTIPELLGLNMWIKGFFALFSLGPKVIGSLQGDGFQMPGVFIIDRSGTIRLAYRSKDAADNPPNTLLIETLKQIQGDTQTDVHQSNKPTIPASAR